MALLTLVTGGARSGKSRWAEELARRQGEPVLYVATARVEDPEMAERVRRHRATRPATWETVECPLDAAAALREHGRRARAVLVDCLTLLVSNLLEQASRAAGGVVARGVEEAVLSQVEALADAGAALPARVIVVTNEVGSGLVPLSPVARRFRDLAGLANQLLAARAAEVYWLVAGIPVRIKGGSPEGRGGGLEGGSGSP